MSRRVTTILALAFLLLAPTAGWCQLESYSQDFEELKLNAPSALSGDGWLVWENVYDNLGTLFYGQGYTAPNGGESFCALVTEEGGEEQGLQQLSVYNNYLNTYHGYEGFTIEINVYQEQMIDDADAGKWLFEFDYKKGNIEGSSTAHAFIKVIDPAAGYSATEEVYFPIPTVDDLWYSDFLEIDIPGEWVGQILQFGFMNTASNWEGSGVFYDNVTVARLAYSNIDIFPETCDHTISKKPTADLVAALTGNPDGLFYVDDVNVDTLALEGVAPTLIETYDIVDQYLELGATCVCPELILDGAVDLVMHFDAAAVVAAAGVKRPGFYVLTLTGEMTDGTPIKLQDCIEIPKPGP